LKFVLDTNVVLKALIKDSMVRGILLGSTHEFLIPDRVIAAGNGASRKGC
jgi:hypothetical protein